MYELSRVLLRSVGPAAARYEDVLIDLSSAGAPVPAAPETLFGEDKPVLRPSPASVLHLENGGGKSVLIKLTFSVVLPGHRQAVGTSNTHTLSSFVLEGDVSHVVLEWVHTKSGRHLVTGKVSAWRNGRPSKDLKQLTECWYHFRPTETLGLRTLPITENGRYRVLSDYCDQLTAAAESDAGLEYSCIRVQKQWTERLVDLGLDPELFRYQRAMNAEEGEAADAFSFSGDDAFVDSLLSAVLPPEPAEELAGVVGAYADKLAVRHSLELEREFVRGALEHLPPLAEARRTRLAGSARRDDAQERLDKHLRLVRIRAHLERHRADGLRTESRGLADELEQETERHAHLIAVTAELRRLVALMRLEEARDEEQQDRDALRQAKLVESGWAAVPTALRHREAMTEDLRLRQVIAETHEAARPALVARDTAAVALRRALTDLRDRTERQAAEAEAAGQGQAALALQAQAEHNAAVAHAAEWAAEAAVHRTSADSVRAELAAAVREGRLSASMTAGEAAEGAQARAVQAGAHVAELEATLTELDQACVSAEESLGSARDTSATADEAFRAAERELTRATARTASLEADPDLPGPADGGTVDLDRDAADLLTCVTAVRREVDAAQAVVQVEIAGDERARTALETTELMPPSVDAIRVRQRLQEEGFTAWTGWEYLASLGSVERRHQIVRQAPRLASGVIVNERFGETADILAKSRLWPTEHLVVGTAAHLLAAAAEDAEAEEPVVVPVHPALYDEQAADDERVRLAERHREQVRQQAGLRDRAERYAALYTRLADWRRDFPPGRLEELRRELRQRESEAAAAGLVLAERQAGLDRIIGERRFVASAIPPARQAHHTAERAVEVLERLAEREARIPGWEGSERTALEAAEANRDTAKRAAERSDRCRALTADHQRSADTLRATAQRIVDELTTLPQADGLPDSDGSAAEQPVEVLRRSFAAAVEELRRVAVGEDLKAKAALARDRLAAADRELGDLSPAVRQQAEELLTGPEAADTVSRALAREAATRVVLSAEERLAESAVLTAIRRAELSAFPEPVEAVDLSPFTHPKHLAEGLSMATEAETARDNAERLRREISHRSERARQRAKEAAREAMLFADLSALLGSGPGGEPAEEEPGFEGDASAARKRHDAARTHFVEADEALTAAVLTERTLTDRLRQHAIDERFAAIHLPNRSIIVAADPAELSANAARWQGLLQQRLRSLETDLDSICRHRRAIIGQLRQQVEEALRIVRRAETLSKLPDRLANWSGRPFLQIGFAAAEDDALTDRLGTVVDQLADEVVNGRPGKRGGLSLVLRGVASAVGTSGFRVRILKPDAVLRDQRVPVSEIKDIFSGGQVLTAAIVLYCTMAALRSSEQGRTRHRHSGVLFLDNPIGRASASYLLQLQQAVASALGVQLVYTTGLFDLNVLENFPLVVRLRNSADLAAHRKYLTVEDTIRPLLDNVRPAERGAEIDAARYYRRPPGSDRAET
ncbi:hypothetical protein [Kitasatospora sp. NPDC008115]|uniref:hypothetical protein n=1 Tax=Kitasatospora sp. NPDC008115 TaxID=3364022 RepID=UPI0036E7812E